MPEKLKDILFPRHKVEYFAQILQEAYPPFESKNFVDCVCDKRWPERELKEKMRHTTLCLHRFLPEDFRQSVEILKALVPKVKGFEAIVLPDYVEVYGLEHWDISLPALGILTKCGSSEFAIRPFLNKNTAGAMQFMQRWAADPDPRVRRLASEGCRPRLPWGMAVPALKEDPSPILPILEKLKNDPAEAVRRSVANNLNDISKDHPELVLGLCERWAGESQESDRIIKHACRSLLKEGNKRAMLLFGFANPEKMQISEIKVSSGKLKIGGEINLSFELLLETEKPQMVRLEYVVHYVKANGKTSPKVFQIREAELAPGTHRIRKKHAFADVSVRKHYPGVHSIEVVVNGEVKAAVSVQLEA